MVGYYLYTSNDALASVLLEQLPFTLLRDTREVNPDSITTPAVMVIDTRKDASLLLDTLTQRPDTASLAIILLHSAASPPPDTLNAYNELFVTPLRLGDILDTIRKITDNFAKPDKSQIILGEYQLLTTTRQLAHAASLRLLELTEKEALLLNTLHPKPMAKEQLLEAVWGYQDGVDTHTLETHIYRLRQKLKDFCGDTLAIGFASGLYSVDIK